MRMVVSSLLLVLAACTDSGGSRPPLARSEQKIAIIPRGQTCAQVGLGAQQFTLTAPADGVYAIDAQNSLTLRYYDDTNTVFYFTNSSIRMTGALVSIGDRTLMWEMPGGADGWPSLHGPIDPVTEDIYTPEEVTFCYDYELYVQPSAYARHAQRASWTITKSGRTDPLVLSEGQTEALDYSVTVRAGQPTAAGQYIDGPLFVFNKSPHTVTVNQVTTMVGSISANIVCPVAGPFTMAPYATVECSFHADLPDTSDRNVVGGGSVSHDLKVTTRESVVSFSAHNVSTVTVDRCIVVTDDVAPYSGGYLGTVCDSDVEATYTFTSEIGPFACGNFTLNHAARYTGLDTGDTADAIWTINGRVACNPGCTLTAQYWKNHSHWGPRRYHPIWNQLGELGEDTSFFQSGGTYIEAMVRRALGNPYWTLARTYIAAKLNRLNGAQVPVATQTALDNAAALLAQNTPAQLYGSQSLRRAAVRAVTALKDFNQGRVGPGRCTCKPDLDSDD